MPYLVILGLIAWFVFGSPVQTLANSFWPEDAAPWETVDAFFYPNREDLALNDAVYGLSDLASCQRWARDQAMKYQDPLFQRTDYECGVGKVDDLGGVGV